MKDLLLTDTGELEISNGDFVAGENYNQQQAMLLVAQEGEFKMTPTIGVGIGDLLLSEELLEYRHKIRDHFKRDNLKVKNLELYEIGKLKIESEPF